MIQAEDSLLLKVRSQGQLVKEMIKTTGQEKGETESWRSGGKETSNLYCVCLGWGVVGGGFLHLAPSERKKMHILHVR